MYRGIRMNIHEINDVLKDVGITGELLDLINIKLKKHPKSQHIPVGIYESCFLDDPQDDMPILHKHCEVIGAQYSEDDEDDMPILPCVKTWKTEFNKVVKHIDNHKYLIRCQKYHQMKLRYRRDFKELMKQNGIKTIKDIKAFGKTLGVSYTMLYKKQECIEAYEQHKLYNYHMEKCPNISYYRKTWDKVAE